MLCVRVHVFFESRAAFYSRGRGITVSFVAGVVALRSRRAPCSTVGRSICPRLAVAGLLTRLNSLVSSTLWPFKELLGRCEQFRS